jgi:hypothetical protein
MSELMAFPAITVIAWGIGEVAKALSIPNKYIPAIVSVVGGLLGLAGMAVVNGFPATDPLTAVAVGIISGLGSTGAHQVVHQLKKEDE